MAEKEIKAPLPPPDDFGGDESPTETLVHASLKQINSSFAEANGAMTIQWHQMQLIAKVRHYAMMLHPDEYSYDETHDSWEPNPDSEWPIVRWDCKLIGYLKVMTNSIDGKSRMQFGDSIKSIFKMNPHEGEDTTDLKAAFALPKGGR